MQISLLCTVLSHPFIRLIPWVINIFWLILKTFTQCKFLPLATLSGLLQDLADESEIMRERTLKMLAMKLRSFDQGAMKPEAKDYVIQECKKILEVRNRN